MEKKDINTASWQNIMSRYHTIGDLRMYVIVECVIPGR